MSQPLLSAQKTLELLRTLKDTITEFAERERKLHHDHSISSSKLREEYEVARDSEQEDQEVALAQLEADHAARRENVESRYQNRKAWIARSYKASKDRLLGQISAREGQGRYDKQRSEIIINRERDTELAGISASYDEAAEAYGHHLDAWKRLNGSAKKALKGFGGLSGMLDRARKRAAKQPIEPADLVSRVQEIEGLLQQSGQEVSALKKRPAVKFFSTLTPLLLSVLLLLAGGGLAFGYYQMAGEDLDYTLLGAIAGVPVGLLVIVFVANAIAGAGVRSSAKSIASNLARVHQLARQGLDQVETERAAALEETTQKFANRVAQLEQSSEAALAEAQQMRNTDPHLLDEQEQRITARHEARYQQQMAALQPDYEAAKSALVAHGEQRSQEMSQTFETKKAEIEQHFESEWQQAQTEWSTKVQSIYAALEASRSRAVELFPQWSPEYCAQWSPPGDFLNAAKFGDLKVQVDELAEKYPRDSRLALPNQKELDVPMLVTIPEQGSFLVETEEAGRVEGIAALNNLIMRLLASTPPGRISFTLLDPVAMGESFAGVMHLSDYEEGLIHSKIWTQTDQIEKRLGELNEHMEKVIQMYLRNEYESITQYNEEAGNIAEKYHYLVVADFPAGFSDLAAKRLHSIASSGGRCGVYSLIHWDRRHKLPPDFQAEDLRASSATIRFNGGHFEPVAEVRNGLDLNLEAPPKGEYAIDFIHKLGKASVDSSRVEVPFSHVAPSEEEIWTFDTTNELRVPIGRTGATKLQYLAIGKGTRQHALIAGKTGSGKSTLFHVMVTNLALWCSPEQVEFYLIDFKKGVEFKAYASKQIPHARVVAIESDREFGLSVLQRVDEELKRRGDMFRQHGAQDIDGYKRAGGTEAVPRTLLMIDEFQEFFVEDDAISQNAAVLLDRIVRQGRAFGIHCILGSQTLGGAFTLARATLGQMAIRIALQCEEADSYLILDDTNPAARLLTRPGEGIYNDSAGAIEANSPFQVVWLPDQVRSSYLDKVVAKEQASGKEYPRPVVFEGNAPAEIRENAVLAKQLAAPAITPVATARMWLGAPNSIKGPTEAKFARQSGNNLLLVGQRDDAILAMIGVAMLSLSAQYQKGGVRFVLMDGTVPDTSESQFLQSIVQAVPHEVTLANNSNVEEVLGQLSQEIQTRSEGDGSQAPAIFFLVHGVQKFRNLRFEEDFGFDTEAAPKPGVMFNNIITEGPSQGIHTVAVVDTYNNVNRCLSRKALTEFEMRVLFQMSQSDSAALIDTPKAGNLGLNRALFYNEQAGYLETFRPYAMPDAEWIAEAGEQLRRLVG